MVETLFTRSKGNPILVAKEREQIYNPAAWHDQKTGLTHLLPRIKVSGHNWQSFLAHFVVKNDKNLKKINEQVLPLDHEFSHLETRGQEDPRLTYANECFFLVYTAYDGQTARLMLTTSKDLKDWDMHGPVFPNWHLGKAGASFILWDERIPLTLSPFDDERYKEWLKAGAVFSELIDKKFWMIFGQFGFWLATSRDKTNWQVHESCYQKPFITARPGYFDNVVVEMGPPPIKTDYGWLVLYNGVDHMRTYRLGGLLLDLDDPTQILWRSAQPLFWPEKEYESFGRVDILSHDLLRLETMSQDEKDKFLSQARKKSLMPKVVFCNGAVLTNDQLCIYYGASDESVCKATAKLSDILQRIKEEKNNAD